MGTTGTVYGLAIEGMSCGHCVRAVTDAIGTVAGVTARSVVVGSATVEAPDQLAIVRVVRAIEEAGYAAAVRPEPAPSKGSCCSTKNAGPASGCCTS